MRWSKHPKLLQRLLELDARGYTQPQMAITLASENPEIFLYPPTRDAIKNALGRAHERAEYIRERPVADISPYFNKYRKEIEGEIIVEKNSTLLAQILAKPRRKILVLSDIHVPFTDEAKLQQAIDLHRTADILVLAGDIMDMYGCSKHRHRKNVPIEVELDNTVRLLEYLSQTFPVIYMFPGNHDARAKKKIQDTLPADLLFLFDEEPLEMLSKPFDNIFYHDDWFLQLGDAVFAHAERSSTIEGRPAILLAEYFEHKGWAKRLEMGRVRCYVQAHTHQLSAVYREDMKMMESGCLAQIMEYVLDSTAVMRPPMSGCVAVVQQDGKTIFNETREYIL